MLFICLCLLTQIFSGYCQDYNDDDDLLGTVNIFMYDSYDECLDDNIMMEKIYNFNIKCDCLHKSECYNKLVSNSDFDTKYIDYNNTKIYLHDLNYSGHCYNYNSIYVKGILNIDYYCVPKIIAMIVVFLVIIFILIITINIVYELKKQKNRPPNYKPTHYNTI